MRYANLWLSGLILQFDLRVRTDRGSNFDRPITGEGSRTPGNPSSIIFILQLVAEAYSRTRGQRQEDLLADKWILLGVEYFHMPKWLVRIVTRKCRN